MLELTQGMLFVFFAGFCAVLGAAQVSKVTVNTTSAVSQVDKEFLCVTTDWWLNDGPYGYKWAPNGGILQVNLSDPLLVAGFGGLTKRQGATWRIGGTPADSVEYLGLTAACAVPNPPIDPWPNTKCLNKTRWDEILAFASAAKIDISFGLNGLYGRATPSDRQNLSNARDLLEYTASSPNGGVLKAVQLGNELLQGSLRAEPTPMGQDFLALQGILHEVFPDVSSRPLLVGPDSIPSSKVFDPFFEAAQGSLNATTYHAYVCSSHSSSCASTLNDSSKLQDAIRGTPAELQSIVKNYGNIPVWGGEVGPAYGGGVPNVSDRFIDFGWYLESLGETSQMGIRRFCRSTGLGGSYELINRTTHHPHPSYWAAYLWTQHMGTNMLSHTDSSTSSAAAVDARLYAACDPDQNGGVTVLVVNFADQASNFSVNVPGATGTRSEVHVRGKDGYTLSDTAEYLDATSTWQTLEIGPAPTYAFPTFSNLPQNPVNAPVVLQPWTYAFLSYPTANAPACK